MSRAILVSFLAFVVAACGGVDSVLPAGGSCNTPNVGTCSDYTGTGWRTPGTVQNTCNQVGTSSMTTATYSSSPCPTASRVGSCITGRGTVQEITLRFYSPRVNTQAAQAACASQGGVYVAG